MKTDIDDSSIHFKGMTELLQETGYEPSSKVLKTQTRNAGYKFSKIFHMDEDKKILSGESGAVTSGLVYNLLTDNSLESFRKEIGLGQGSVVLCISTEGDTDKENYRHIVWNGWYRSPDCSR